jgi:hypothetical protein
MLLTPRFFAPLLLMKYAFQAGKRTRGKPFVTVLFAPSFCILALFRFYFHKYTLFSFILKNGPSARRHHYWRQVITCRRQLARQLVWRVHVRADAYVDLMWQHIGADLSADLKFIVPISRDKNSARLVLQG